MDMKIVRRGQINTLKMIAQDKQGFEKCLEKTNQGIEDNIKSCWLKCVLRGDEAVYWVSIGQQWSQHLK